MLKKGQSLLEYILLIGIVTMALIYMGTDLKRGLQSVVKVTADQLGNQVQAEQEVEYRGDTGSMVNSISSTDQVRRVTTTYTAGGVRVQDTDSTTSYTETISNLSFTSNTADEDD